MHESTGSHPMIVVDASLLVDGLMTGGPARRLLGEEDLFAPHLVDLEVTHALRRRVQSGLLPSQAVPAQLAVLRQMGIMRYPTHGLTERIWELRDNVTAYDAVLVGGVRAAEDRRHAEHREQLGARELRRHPLRAVVARDDDRLRAVQRERGEHLLPPAQEEELRVGPCHVHEAAVARHAERHAHQPRRIAEGQWAQQRAVGQCEDRHCRADADRLPAGLLRQRLGDLRGLLLVAAHQRHVRPCLGERPGHHQAQPAVATGHQRRPAIEPECIQRTQLLPPSHRTDDHDIGVRTGIDPLAAGSGQPRLVSATT